MVSGPVHQIGQDHRSRSMASFQFQFVLQRTRRLRRLRRLRRRYRLRRLRRRRLQQQILKLGRG